MIAYDILSDNYAVNISDLNLQVSAYASLYSGDVGANRIENRTEILLESCTIDHFSNFPNIQDSFSRLRIGQWQCLPLNQQYTLESSFILNGNFQSLNLVFNCSGSCNDKFQNLNIWLYTLSSAINPTNSEKA